MLLQYNRADSSLIGYHCFLGGLATRTLIPVWLHTFLYRVILGANGPRVGKGIDARWLPRLPKCGPSAGPDDLRSSSSIRRRHMRGETPWY